MNEDKKPSTILSKRVFGNVGAPKVRSLGFEWLKGLGEFWSAHTLCPLPTDPKARIGFRLGVALVGSTFSIFGNRDGLTLLSDRLTKAFFTQNWDRNEDLDQSLRLDEIWVENLQPRIECVFESELFPSLPSSRCVLPQDTPSDEVIIGFEIQSHPWKKSPSLHEDGGCLVLKATSEWFRKIVEQIESIAKLGDPGSTYREEFEGFSLEISQSDSRPSTAASGYELKFQPYRLKARKRSQRSLPRSARLSFQKGGRTYLPNEDSDRWEVVPKFYLLMGTSLGFRHLAQAMLSAAPKRGVHVTLDSHRRLIQTGRGGFNVERENLTENQGVLSFELTEDGDWRGLNRGEFVRRLSWEKCPNCLGVFNGSRSELVELQGDGLLVRLDWDAWLALFTVLCWLDLRDDVIEFGDACYGDFEFEMAYPVEDDWEDMDSQPNLRIALWPKNDWNPNGRPEYVLPPFSD